MKRIRLTLIRPGAIMPHLRDFSDCSGTHTDGTPSLAGCFLSTLAHLLKYFFSKIGPTVTKSRDLFSFACQPENRSSS